jgi:transposase-like protein
LLSGPSILPSGLSVLTPAPRHYSPACLVLIRVYTLNSVTYGKTTLGAIIAGYLAGGTSYRKLSEKYGIKHPTIHAWVLSYQGRGKGKIKVNHLNVRLKKDQPSESDVKKLQRELEKERLLNKLLNAMIDIAEE